ncbi:hypothetical protein BY996DRAFT_6419155 [Phakopsora pachyrhizi]|nr:hypothetical protein BY996DRAFT_6419155 [Phakopsora pachyrhizi]
MLISSTCHKAATVMKGRMCRGAGGQKDKSRCVDMEISTSVEKILTWNAELIGRMIELSASSNVPENVFVLLKIKNKINTIGQKALELTITWLGACLNMQKKLDFKPKNNEIEFDRMNTEACESSCRYLDKVQVILVKEQSVSGKNIGNLLNKAGVVVFLQHAA